MIQCVGQQGNRLVAFPAESRIASQIVFRTGSIRVVGSQGATLNLQGFAEELVSFSITTLNAQRVGQFAH